MTKRATFLLLASWMALGCGNGQSTEEATEACDAERARIPASFDEAAYQDCIACHEECGDACATVDTAIPAQFTCPEN